MTQTWVQPDQIFLDAEAKPTVAITVLSFGARNTPETYNKSLPTKPDNQFTNGATK